MRRLRGCRWPGRPGTAAPGRGGGGLGLGGLDHQQQFFGDHAPRTVRRSTIVRSTPNAARHGTARNSPRNVWHSALEIPPASFGRVGVAAGGLHVR